MSRYRPPQKPGSKYITPEGKKRLSDEFEYLWRTKRPEVTAALAAAAAGPSGRVIAIAPDPRGFPILERNVDRKALASLEAAPRRSKAPSCSTSI